MGPALSCQCHLSLPSSGFVFSSYAYPGTKARTNCPATFRRQRRLFDSLAGCRKIELSINKRGHWILCGTATCNSVTELRRRLQDAAAEKAGTSKQATEGWALSLFGGEQVARNIAVKNLLSNADLSTTKKPRQEFVIMCLGSTLPTCEAKA